MGHRGGFPSRAAAAHAMARLEVGDFGAVRRHEDGRIHVEAHADVAIGLESAT